MASSHLAASAGLVVGNAVAGLHVNVRFRVVCVDAAAHPLLDLAGHGQERLLDVAGILCGCLEEGDAEAVGKLLWGRCEHDALRRGGDGRRRLKCIAPPPEHVTD